MWVGPEGVVARSVQVLFHVMTKPLILLCTFVVVTVVAGIAALAASCSPFFRSRLTTVCLGLGLVLGASLLVFSLNIQGDFPAPFYGFAP